MDIIKLGSNTWLNVGVVRMVQKRDSYARIWFVDGDYKDITGEWEKNMVKFLDSCVGEAKGSSDAEDKSVLDDPWTDLPVGTRTRNMIADVIAPHHSIHTIRDLYKIASRDYLKFRGFGDGCMDDLNMALECVGLRRICEAK